MEFLTVENEPGVELATLPPEGWHIDSEDDDGWEPELRRVKLSTLLALGTTIRPSAN
jgi:hypothetical protein